MDLEDELDLALGILNKKGVDTFDIENEKLKGMIYRVFVENPDGAKLLEFWVNEFVLSPSIQPNYTQFEAGLIEGGKNFVRKLILIINDAEKREEKPSIFKFLKVKK